MDILYTISDVTKRCNVGRSTIYRENKADRLPFVKIGRATRIRAGDLEAWLDSFPTIRGTR